MKGANLTSRERKLMMQRQAMEKQRFGMTRDEIIQRKGQEAYTCAICGMEQDPYATTTVVDHKDGGGRHATENGMIVPDKTHVLSNLQLCHDSCAGRKDAMRKSMGMGMEGNPNNKA